jgi:hypothetical protein
MGMTVPVGARRFNLFLEFLYNLWSTIAISYEGNFPAHSSVLATEPLTMF